MLAPLAAILLLYSSCGGGMTLQSADTFPFPAANEEQAVFRGIHRKRRFKVCWLQDHAETVGQRNRVKEIILQEYGKTPVEFYGFGNCTDDVNEAYRIYVYDDAELSPRVADVGHQIDKPKTTNGFTWHVVLNFSYKNWSKICSKPKYQDNCTTFIALHEFGHLLGRVHEHAHHDSTCRDYRLRERIGGFRTNFPYDASSVMNYCLNGEYTFARKTRRLSAGDISATWKAYGAAFGNGYARVTHGTALKRSPEANKPEHRCKLNEGSSFRFSYLGTYGNHIKIQLLDAPVRKACASKLRRNTAFIFPGHFAFWK